MECVYCCSISPKKKKENQKKLHQKTKHENKLLIKAEIITPKNKQNNYSEKQKELPLKTNQLLRKKRIFFPQKNAKRCRSNPIFID